MLLTDWKPFLLVLILAALFVALLPLIVLILMRLTADRKIMGEHANGWVTNLVMAAIIVVSVYLTYQNAINLWGDIRTAW